MERTAWYDRFTQQARWTADLRRYLFGLAQLERAARVLEVGCGGGAVLAALPPVIGQLQAGLDIVAAHLQHARSAAPGAALTQADAHQLPYASASFDIVFCHFLLLWVAQPAAALAEMLRVVRPGGWVLALAEPDYGGRIDYPEALAAAGRLQAQALSSQGADPRMGRRLLALFNAAGLERVSAGVLGGQWPQGDDADWRQEWEVLRDDLGDRLTPVEASRLLEIETDARRNGERLLFVPTFYAAGEKASGRG